jgi:hypothetical protein
MGAVRCHHRSTEGEFSTRRRREEAAVGEGRSAKKNRPRGMTGAV